MLTEDRLQRMQYTPFNRNNAFFQAFGHLLLVSVGSNVFAIDTLRSGENNPPKIFWSQSIDEMSGDASGMQQVILQGPFAVGYANERHADE